MARTPSKSARKKMVAAAGAIVVARGVKGLTIDEVAKKSGVAKTTIYRHFATKNELLLAAVDSSVTYPEAPDTGTLSGDIRELLERVLPSFADTNARAVFLDMFSAAARDPELEDLRKVFDGGHGSPVATVYKRWFEKGEISAEIDLQTAFEIIDGPFLTRSLLWPERLENVDLDPLVNRIMGQLTS